MGRQRQHSVRPGAILDATITLMLVAALLGISLLSFFQDYVYAGASVSITRIIQPSSADTYNTQNSPDNNRGDRVEVRIHSESPSANRRGLVQFDISSIPTGSTLSSASLQLNLTVVSVTGSRTHDFHRVTSSWDESTVTWNTMPTFNATPTDGAATGTTTGVWISWDVTDDVSAYLAETAANYGWLLKDAAEDAAAQEQVRYHSKKSLSPTLMPKLSITFTAPWDSYEDSGHNTIRDTFTSSYATTYMKGTGFSSGTYNVSYYDAGINGGQKVITDNNISVDGTGVLSSAYGLTDNPDAAAGTWHALVQPTGGAAFPTNYNDAVAAPDTYDLVANDSFTADESAIPEFPTLLTAVAVIGSSCGVYLLMRRRMVRVKALSHLHSPTGAS